MPVPQTESLHGSTAPPLASTEGGAGFKPFAYWRDPLCLASWCAYALNRFYLTPHFGSAQPFLRDHFNDSLLIPSALPLLFGVRRFLKLRTHDAPPSAREVVFWLVLWSLFFEALGPKIFHYSVGDWRDVAAYWVGGVISWAVWKLIY